MLILESRNITVDSQFEAPESVSEDDDVMQTGFLQYSATVVDTEIGKDQFTEVVIKPLHHLSNIYVTLVFIPGCLKNKTFACDRHFSLRESKI